MTDADPDAAPGWYPDPHDAAGRLRYWDGSEWTDHFHDQAESGALPNIGDWFNSTFAAVGAHGIPALGLALGATLVVNTIMVVMFSWAIGEQAVIDEQFVGDGWSLGIRFGLLVLLLTLVQGVAWLAINRFMQRAHQHHEPSVGEAISHAVTRVPRLIGVTLVLLGVAVACVAVVLGVVGLTGRGELGALAFVLLAPFVVWAWVKFSFLSAAVVAAPLSTSALRASMAVSAGRFWAVFGRLLLVSVGLGMVLSVVGAAFGGLGGLPIDQDALNSFLVVEDGTFVIEDFTFAELLPDTGALVAFVVVNSVLGAVGGLISTSAFMRLYLDSGAPTDL